tara:strand:- start:349 stop:1116 length:768 start_codon:yes stop_codon:yes gene_type:complete
MKKFTQTSKHHIRVDLALVEKGLAKNRSRAQALVLAGKVFSGEQRINKAGMLIQKDMPLEVRGQDHPWVSRGGVKLNHALNQFQINVDHKICLDIGSSTGGFTQVLLSRGALRVYSVDVGHGQLDWKLRTDNRVILLEKTNARHLSINEIPEQIDLIVCDASFIGLETLLPSALSLASPNAILSALIKPQFEAGKDQVGKGGIVKNPDVHEAVCKRISSWINSLPEWKSLNIIESIIAGAEGNKEFFIHAERKKI